MNLLTRRCHSEIQTKSGLCFCYHHHYSYFIHWFCDALTFLRRSNYRMDCYCFILSATLIISVGLLLWCCFSINYMIRPDYLLVSSGPFRSRIPYEDITQISYTNDILTGYRILSSKDALEISYKKAFLGSVKVSPEDKDLFISELVSRCPNVKAPERSIR